MHALAVCVTAGIATTAAARKIELTGIESTVRGESDVRGALGVDPDVRNGYQRVFMDVTVDGDASPADLEALVESGKARSAVYDMLSATTPVEVRTV